MIVRKPSPSELSTLDTPPLAVQDKVNLFLPKVVEWFSQVELELSPIGRPLTQEETQQALAIGVINPSLVRVVVKDEFPMPTDKSLLAEARKYGLGSWAEGGRTNGHLILLKPRVANYPTVLRHELVHVSQLDRMGRENFLRRYLTELEIMGYARSPLELEAYAKQGGN